MTRFQILKGEIPPKGPEYFKFGKMGTIRIIPDKSNFNSPFPFMHYVDRHGNHFVSKVKTNCPIAGTKK